MPASPRWAASISICPNAETVAAMEAARRGELVTVGGVDGLVADLHADG